MESFFYARPRTLNEVFDAFETAKGPIHVLAGGTGLLVDLRGGDPRPQDGGDKSVPAVVDLKAVDQLGHLVEMTDEGGLSIGALATMTETGSSRLVGTYYRALAQAARSVGSPQVRNRATVGGNLCTASPAADTAPALLVFDADVRLISRLGERTIKLRDFFVGPRRTALRSGELLAEIVLPPAPRSTSAYLRLASRSALDLAVVGCAVFLTMDGRFCTECRIGLGAVGPTPFRAERAETVLRGRTLSSENIQEASDVASSETTPISDVRASAEFRRWTTRILVGRAIMEAVSYVPADTRCVH